MDANQVIRDAVDRAFQGMGLAYEIAQVTGRVRDCAIDIACAMTRPSVLYRPTVAIDGNKWHALYGPNQMEGVSGFGDSPAEAMADFDRAWVKSLEKAQPAEVTP